MYRERAHERPTGALRRAWLSILAAVVVVGAVAGPVGAQDPVDEDPPKTPEEQAEADAALLETLDLAPESPPAADDPFVEVVVARERLEARVAERLEATQVADEANLASFLAAVAYKEAVETRDAATLVRDAASAELATERNRMSDLTVQAFVSGDEVDLETARAYLEGDTTDAAAGRNIMFSQVLALQEQATADARAVLDKANAALDDARAEADDAEAEAARRLATSTRANQRRLAAEQAHADAIATVDAADVRLRTAAFDPIDPVPEDVPLIGLPRLTGEDLATWFAQSAYRPRVSTPIEDYADWFIEEGKTEGIRGDIAFAQAVLETGGFTNTDSVEGHNFSGIGHYDNLARGWTFPSPRLGVRAQIQLLKSYAVKDPAYANELVDPRLRGPAGCCETWGDLTTVWATDPTYGPKVMLIYTSIVEHALARRARGEGFEETTG
ncbi:MAG: glucosaminidase domain-containing protein [Acidimicrobiales bacterium]|nr:glucosaminidase domain-containing protein [Acidimicrobiales bacterium]